MLTLPSKRSSTCALLALLVAIVGCDAAGDETNARGGGVRDNPRANDDDDDDSSLVDESAPAIDGSEDFKPSDTPSTRPIMQIGGLDEDTCARADISLDRIRPRIVFLVDASSSMSEDLGGISRWNAMRTALLDADGVVPNLEDLVKFGLVTYAGPRFTTCPDYRYATPGPANFALIDAAFPADPPLVSSTPTGAAMDWAIDNAFLDPIADPDAQVDPQFMIFATDGEPNGCAVDGQEPPRDFDSVLAAANRAANRGITIFVLSLAEATGEFADHLTEVATIGGTGTVFSPRNKEALVSELETIVGGAISCEVELSGLIYEALACEGTVTLNDEPLPCDDPDGWEVVDDGHIKLNGEACDRYRLSASAAISADFPCAVIR